MKNFVQYGESVDVTLSGSVAGGDVVELNSGLIGVAVSSGGSGDLINVKTQGVYTLPKTAGGSTGAGVGTKVYWSGTAVTLTPTDKPLGFMWQTSLDADTTAVVGIFQDSGLGGSGSAANVAALVDNTGGTVNSTLVAIPATTPGDLTAQGVINGNIRDNLADLAGKVNAVIAALKAAGLMASS